MSGTTEQELDARRRAFEEDLELALRNVEKAVAVHDAAQAAERRAWDELQATIRSARYQEATLEELADVSGLPQMQVRWIVDGMARRVE